MLQSVSLMLGRDLGLLLVCNTECVVFPHLLLLKELKNSQSGTLEIKKGITNVN